jgi:hypothetical protein
VKFVAVAVLVLAAAVAFTGAVLLTRDHGKKTVTVAPPQPSVSTFAKELAGEQGISPEAAEERIRIKNQTCNVLGTVGASAVYHVCWFNILNGDPWFDGMPPRQLREVSRALIAANQ